MNKTTVVSSPKYYLHNTGTGHPESAKRLRAIVSEVKRVNIHSKWGLQFTAPHKAEIEEIGLVHGLEYIRLVEAVCKSGGGFLDLEDTVVSPESFDVARYAVGGTLDAVKLVMERRFDNSFALVRPPGHHASKFRALGFCVFNNVAIAAQYLLTKFKLKRILILDMDAHHGNGTQETFYATDRVLYTSLHENPRFFPGTGFLEETGENEGLGFNVNISLPFGTTDQIYLKAVKEVVVPIIRQYSPEFMLISAGLDSHYADPVGRLALSAMCYDQIFKTITELALKTCGGRFVVVLEGGYNPSFVGKLAAIALGRMSKNQYVIRDEVPKSEKKITKQGEYVIRETKKIQSNFWKLD